MIRSSQGERKEINMARTVEDSILRLDHRLGQLNKKVSDLKNEGSSIQTETLSMDLKFKQVWSDLENLQGKIENITEEINKYNVPLLYQEKESLIHKMRTLGVT
jgi:peptidoglycan hydrolase CwlO-like protein